MGTSMSSLPSAAYLYCFTSPSSKTQQPPPSDQRILYNGRSSWTYTGRPHFRGPTRGRYRPLTPGKADPDTRTAREARSERPVCDILRCTHSRRRNFFLNTSLTSFASSSCSRTARTRASSPSGQPDPWNGVTRMPFSVCNRKDNRLSSTSTTRRMSCESRMRSLAGGSETHSPRLKQRRRRLPSGSSLALTPSAYAAELAV
mmetsp:Transcript_60512/g.194843  ORF Transcript_60512/g.194843 Transcript_60512/m.194843 type:complete len:202 (-) Transcript_60512:371-976(-)